MAAWGKIAADAPAFAERVRRRFEMGTNKTLATVRRDGSPRITAIEAQFSDSDVTLGMMGDSVNLATSAEIRGWRCTARRSSRRPMIRTRRGREARRNDD